MKLLIFFIFLQLNLNFEVGFGLFFINSVHASEVSDSSIDTYEVRYQRWLRQKNNRKKNTTSSVDKKSATANLTQMALELKNQALKEKVLREKKLKLPASLPTKTADSTADSKVASAPTDTPVPRRVRDAREEFLSNIPKDNKQVRALLSMVDHTKVYFSINTDGKLKDLFKDDRFKEIYTEEMSKPTKKLTYYFFKSYQDANKNPNEPVAKRLNRDIKINREKIESYLETTGIKSKLTRSLKGAYPKVPVQQPDADQDNNVTVGSGGQTGGTTTPAVEE